MAPGGKEIPVGIRFDLLAEIPSGCGQTEIGNLPFDEAGLAQGFQGVCLDLGRMAAVLQPLGNRLERIDLTPPEQRQAFQGCGAQSTGLPGSNGLFLPIFFSRCFLPWFDIIGSMKSTAKIAALAAVLLLAGALFWQTGRTQTQAEYFHWTGHYVEGEFLAFYRSHRHPELVYGFPTTEAFVNAEGLFVQYFQRARFELHPQNPAAQRVLLTPLGAELYQPAEPVLLNGDPNPCRFFPQTGFSVCRLFLDFFDEYGGVAQFGFPISPLERHHGRLVQYFQNARFDWHPDSDPGEPVVQLGDLGRLYFYEAGEDPIRERAVAPREGSLQVLDLQVHAFPMQPVLPAGGKQPVYVIVQDQTLHAVSDVVISLQVRLPNRQVLPVVAGTTNAAGFVGGLVEIPAETPAGLAVVEVTVSAPAFTASTLTSFRIIAP